MVIFFYILTVFLIVEAILTAYTTISFRRFFLSRIYQESKTLGKFPKVAMLIPCKGLDENLRQNIESWQNQSYPNYQVFVVVESPTDEAVSVLKEFTSLHVFVAGKTEDSGQKIHNLRYLIEQLPENIEVLAFADSDGKLTPDWLSSLIHELLLHPQDTVTGYRWFLSTGSLFSDLRTVWNSGVLTLFSSSGKGNFAWGGTTALFKKTFFEADVLSHWQGSLSDDLSLTRAVYGIKRKIHFAPKAIAFTEGEITAREFFSWIARQFLITKFYRPGLWLAAFSYHWIWTLWLVTGFTLMPLRCLLIFLFLQLFQGIKAELRLSCMKHLLGKSAGMPVGAGLRPFRTKDHWAAWLLSPVVGLINTVVLTSNLFSHTITWRGIVYRVEGSNRLTILQRL